MDEWVIQIGENIRAQRKRSHLTQEHLAELADVDPSYIGQIERGLQVPSLKILWKLSVSLRISLSQLLKIESSTNLESLLEEIAHLINDLSPQQQEKLIQVIRIFVDFRRDE